MSVWTTYDLRSDDLVLTCLPGVGGRLWDIVYKGQSLLWQNPDLAGCIPNLSKLTELPTKSPQFKFPLWGGEKTWIAPDKDWQRQAPYPVLDSGPYEHSLLQDQTIIMTSPICEISKLQVERKITLIGSRSWQASHRVTNRGEQARTVGAWPVMMLKRPARVAITMPDGDTAADVFGRSDGMINVTGHSVTAAIDRLQEFKVGLNSADGAVCIELHGRDHPIFLSARVPNHSTNASFAHGHGFELFSSADYPYWEAEWHSPIEQLEPGGALDFVQEFELIDPAQQAS